MLLQKVVRSVCHFYYLMVKAAILAISLICLALFGWGATPNRFLKITLLQEKFYGHETNFLTFCSFTCHETSLLFAATYYGTSQKVSLNYFNK